MGYRIHCHALSFRHFSISRAFFCYGTFAGEPPSSRWHRLYRISLSPDQQTRRQDSYSAPACLASASRCYAQKGTQQRQGFTSHVTVHDTGDIIEEPTVSRIVRYKIARLCFSRPIDQFLRSIHHLIHPSINQSINSYIDRFIDQPIDQSIYRSIDPSINSPLNPLMGSSIVSPINLSIYQSIHRSMDHETWPGELATKTGANKTPREITQTKNKQTREAFSATPKRKRSGDRLSLP